MATNEIILFESADHEVTLPVKVDISTTDVWLNRKEMATLFDRDIKTIGKHIGNALKEELAGSSTVVAKFATTGSDGKTYQVEHYNLDVIISVGYRVKSQRGVEFRRWATDVLHRYIIKGHVENEKRLKQLGTVARIIERLPEDLGSREILDIVESYTDVFKLLDEYDREQVPRPKGCTGTFMLDYDECIYLIKQIRGKFSSDLFGQEKDDSFRSSIPSSINRSAARTSIPRCRKRQRTSCISSSRTIRSSMATNVSVAASSCIISTATGSCSKDSTSASRTAPLLPSH